jgi:two-component system, sporulation sensor kinase E
MKQLHPELSDRAWDGWAPINLLNAGVMWIDKSLYITVFNALGAELLDNCESLGKPLRLDECLWPDGEAYKILVSMVASEREFRDFIVTWETNGFVRHVLIDSFVQFDEKKRCKGMHVVMKDLGNFSLLEQQMQRTDKLATVGKIAAGIAHEIRNPLTTIKGFLQMLEKRFTEQNMNVELQYAQVMLTEIDRVNSLVSELLLLSKPHKVEKLPCSLLTILNELHPLIESQAILRSIEYDMSIPTDLPAIVADAQMIKQVILNLVKNAFEAMDVGGTLRLSAAVEGDFICIDVTDTGPGIPYYQMDKIFDAFFTTKDKGTGLGLPICQRIVVEHGGEIRVSSKGYGTTFTVLLPISSSGR